MTSPVTTTSTTVAVTTDIKLLTTVASLTAAPILDQTTSANQISNTLTTATVAATNATFTDIPETTVGEGGQVGNPAYLVLAIVLPVAFCVIIILTVCFVTYKRGLRSRKRAKEAAQKSFEARITPKNPRHEELKNAGSTDQSGNVWSGKVQSTSSTFTFDQSAGKDGDKSNFVNVKIENEYVKPGAQKGEKAVKEQTYENAGMTNGAVSSEPQYENFVVVHSSALSPEKNQSGPKSPDSIQSPTTKVPMAGKFDQSDGEKTKNDKSADRGSQYQNVEDYEHVGTPESVPEAIYENTLQPQDDENMYEEANVAKIQQDDIYVDMV